MRSQEVPEIIKITKKSEKWILMKTNVFIVFLGGWDINIQHILHSKIIKNHTCNPNMLFDTSNHRKSRNVMPNGLPWGTQNPLKMNENPTWDPSGSSLVHLCSNWSPKWCQSGLQGPPNRPKIIPLGTQMDIQINKNQYPYTCCSLIDSMFSILQIFLILQIPSVLQMPPVHKLPNCCWPEGPAAGAKP